MAVLTAQLLHLLIHHRHKGVAASCHMLCQSVSRLVGRSEQHVIKAVLHCHLVPRLQRILVAGALFHVVDSVIGKCNHIIQIGIFNHDQSR